MYMCPQTSVIIYMYCMYHFVVDAVKLCTVSEVGQMYKLYTRVCLNDSLIFLKKEGIKLEYNLNDG